MSHPDFRLKGKIFASLGGPDDDWGMVKPFMKEAPGMFAPCAGTWGKPRSSDIGQDVHSRQSPPRGSGKYLLSNQIMSRIMAARRKTGVAMLRRILSHSRVKGSLLSH